MRILIESGWRNIIPMVQQQMALILELQTADFWQDITPAILENVRKRIRLLVKLIDKAQRRVIFTDFEDVIGDEESVELLPGTSQDMTRFHEKTDQYIRKHEDLPVIRKVKWNEPLTPGDLAELERLLIAAGTVERSGEGEIRGWAGAVCEIDGGA